MKTIEKEFHKVDFSHRARLSYGNIFHLRECASRPEGFLYDREVRRTFLSYKKQRIALSLKQIHCFPVCVMKFLSFCQWRLSPFDDSFHFLYSLKRSIEIYASTYTIPNASDPICVPMVAPICNRSLSRIPSFSTRSSIRWQFVVPKE